MAAALGAALAATAGAALLGPGQLWLAHASGVLEPAQDYTAGNDTWSFQQYLLAWYTASALALAGGFGWLLTARHPRWHVRIWVVVGAVAGAATGLPVARDWSAGAEAVDDPVWGATLAILIGLAIGAGGALLATVSPSVRIGLFGWTGWTWAMTATAAAMGRDATPFGLPPTPPQSDAMIWSGILGTLVVFAVLGAWAARRGDRLPALGAVSGPLLTGTVSGVLGQFIGFGGDHYTLGTEFVVGLLLSLLGGGVAAAAAGLTRSRSSLTRREPQRDGQPSGGQSGRV